LLFDVIGIGSNLPSPCQLFSYTGYVPSLSVFLLLVK
jgi:hypothetical protein